MSAVEFTVPIRVVSVANVREHWAARAKRNKLHREAIYLAAQYGGHLGRLVDLGRGERIRVTLTRIAPRELDGHDNIRSSLKHVADEITQLLGLANDRDGRLSWEYSQEKGGVREYGVRIRVEP